jgi:hypothetical protein
MQLRRAAADSARQISEHGRFAIFEAWRDLGEANICAVTMHTSCRRTIEWRSCWHSLAAVHPLATRRPRARLAVRRLGHSGWAFGDCRGLSGLVVLRLANGGLTGNQHDASSSPVLACRSRSPPCGLPRTGSVAARTDAGAGGGLDIGRSRLDTFGQRADDFKTSNACDLGLFSLY